MAFCERLGFTFGVSFRSMLFALALVGITLTGSLPAAQPNVIFILCDDLGYGDVGVFFQNLRKTNNIRSEPWTATPKLDTLAAEGARLTHHYCPASVCAPSRASLLLGVHQGHSNVRDNQFDKALENNHTLATVLKAAGYTTAAVGKWGLQGSGGTPALWPAYPTKRGFDYYYGYVRHGDGHEHYPKEGGQGGGPKEVWENDTEVSAALDKCYTTDLFTARAKRWIMDQRATNSTQPFFLYLAYDTPHAVLELPTQEFPAGGGTNGGLQWLGAPGNMINTASGSIDSYYHPDYATSTWDADANPGTAEVAWPDVYKRYATIVRRIDDSVNDLVTLLKQLNLDTNTLIVFSSDNGPSKESYLPENYDPTFFNSFGPFDGIKRDLWEGGVRMPTIARWPGRIATNSVCAVPSQFHDWLPTFADAAGLVGPARSDGVSLLPALTGSGTQRTPTVYAEYFEGGTTPNYVEFLPSHRSRTRNQMQLLRLGNLQGVRYNIASATNNFEIYDVVIDPQQATNLALLPANAALQQQMKDRVLQLRRPDSSAPRPYDSAYVPATTNTLFTNSVLNFATYQGSWPWVPEFAVLPSVSTGLVAGLNLAVRPRETNYGVAFSGYVSVPADGDYTFYVTSDSGAHLRIHDATVVDDDFNRTGAEVGGTFRLKAGRHPFRLYYRHAAGAQTLNLNYSGPGISKQPVPLNAFSIVGTPDSRPLAVNDYATTTQSRGVIILVLANDSDDGLPQPLAITAVNPPAGGTATLTNGTQIFYQPGSNFLGEDFFSYTISDGLNFATASVDVVVAFTNGEIWLPFNQTSGLTTPDAGGAYTGALNSFPDDITPWVPGKWNQAIQFDGATEFVSIGSYLPPAGTSARTTAAWIKTTGTGSIIAWGPNATSVKWMMRIESGVSFTGALRLEVGGGSVVGTRDLRDGLWHHVAAVLPQLASPNATNIILYVDGTVETLSSKSTSAINTTSAIATIGVDTQNRYFAGTIDEVRIYNRALTAGEIAALYAATNQSAAAWNYRYFGNATINWNADDDGDDAVRLLEYALGGEPWIKDAAKFRLSPAIVGNHLQVQFLRRLAGTSELQYEVQVSPDLKDWSTLTASEIAVGPADVAGFETVTYQADAAVPAQSPLFLRLKIQ
jgi:arylsulfatase A-like enzyme